MKFSLDNLTFWKKKPEIKQEHKEITISEIISKTIWNANSKYLTIILTDGEVITADNVGSDVVERVKGCATREEMLKLLAPKPEYKEKEQENPEIQEQIVVSNYLEIFEGNEDFEVSNNQLFLRGVKNIPIPAILTANFIEILQAGKELELDEDYEEYNTLLLFTAKLMLNPLESSRNQLLTFCRNNNITISSRGNLICYRRVVSKHSEEDMEYKELMEFVSKAHTKIKSQKKGVRNYEVFQDLETKEFFLLQIGNQINKETHNTYLATGNLYELYNSIPITPENKYYSQHGNLEIKLGEVYKIDDNDVDLNADVCHAGGNTPVIVLINPSKTITVPTHEISKMRVSEMFVIGIHENEGSHISEDFIQHFDEEYHNYTLSELKLALSEKSLEPVSVSEAVSELSLKEVQNISTILRDRIINIL